MNKFISDIKQLKINKFIKFIWQLIISTSNATLDVPSLRPCLHYTTEVSAFPPSITLLITPFPSIIFFSSFSYCNQNIFVRKMSWGVLFSGAFSLGLYFQGYFFLGGHISGWLFSRGLFLVGIFPGTFFIGGIFSGGLLSRRFFSHHHISTFFLIPLTQ